MLNNIKSFVLPCSLLITGAIDKTISLPQYGLGTVVSATKASAGLPQAGDEYDFYRSFSGFQEFCESQGDNLLRWWVKCVHIVHCAIACKQTDFRFSSCMASLGNIWLYITASLSEVIHILWICICLGYYRVITPFVMSHPIWLLTRKTNGCTQL